MELDIKNLSTYSYRELEMALHIAGGGFSSLIPHTTAQIRAEIERRSTPAPTEPETGEGGSEA